MKRKNQIKSVAYATATLITLILILNVSAGDLYDEVGLGRGFKYASPHDTLVTVNSEFLQIASYVTGLPLANGSNQNNYAEDRFRSALFIKQKYQNANWTLNFTNTQTSAFHYVYVYELNYTSSTKTETWTPIAYCESHFNATNISWGYACNFSTNTNTGILLIAPVSISGGSTKIMTDSTTSVTYTSSAPLGELMVAGSSYTIPIVNWYYSQKTQGVDTDTNVVFYAENTTGLYYNTITPSCDAITSESTIYNFINVNSSNLAQYQTFLFYTNVTAITELNFSLINPTNNTAISIPTGGTANFSVSVNNPAAVDYFVLYVNGSVDTINPSTNGTFHKRFDIAGNYTVELQVEDNTCNRYPTARWTVNVGNVVELVGYSYKNVSGIPQTLVGATVTINRSGFISSKTTDEYGYYKFDSLTPATYTIVFSKYGYSSDTYTRNLSAGTFSPTQYTQNGILNPTTNNASVLFHIYGLPSYTPILNSTLQLYLGGELVATAYNGTSTGNKYGITTATNNNDIGAYELPFGEYTAVISKAGYNSTTETLSMSTDNPLDELYVYLNQTITLTYSVNFTNVQPNGATINLSQTPIVTLNATMNTSNHPYTVCSYIRQSGYPYTSGSCYIDTLTGTNIKLEDNQYYLSDGTTYYFQFIANSSGNTFSTGEYSFNTIGVSPVTTTSTTAVTLNPTTTTSRPIKPNITTTTINTTAPTTTTIPYGNGSAINTQFNCTNMTGMLQKGDVFHCAVCPFIMVLGVNIFYGLTLLFIMLIVFLTTKNYAAMGMIGLIYSSLFLEILPQPTINYLSVGVGLGIGLGLYGILFKK